MSEENKNADRAFEILGVYFANCYWTRLYKKSAESMKNGDFLNLHEAYKVTVEQFNRSFGKQERIDERINPEYSTVIADLKNYYEEQINKLRTIEGKPLSIHLSDRDFIDTMSKYMLPKDEYEKLGKYDIRKEKYFRLVMTQSVAKFTMFTIRSGVPDVIDNQIRNDNKTSIRYIRSWCDQFISIITSERDQICNLILASRSGIDISKENMESVPKMVVDKLQEEMQTLINEKSELETTVNKYVDYASTLKKLLSKEQHKREKLEKAIRKYIKSAPAASINPSNPTEKHEKHENHKSKRSRSTVPSVTSEKRVEIVGNSVTKHVSDEKNKKVEKAISNLEAEEFSGEEYIKPPESGKYLEEVDESQLKGNSEESYDSDEVLESVSSDLEDYDELEADE